MATIDKNNAMLIDIQYVGKNRRTGDPDCLYTIYKNIDSGEKFVLKTENPEIPIYVEKEEFRNHSHCKEWANKNTLDMKKVKYSDVPFEVAKIMGKPGQQFIQNAIQTKQFDQLRNLNLYPYVFGQDYDIRTIYRYSWLKSMEGHDNVKLRKSFLDIETDILSSPGMPRPTKDPIDLVSIADLEKRRMHTFILTGREYKPLSESEISKLRITEKQRKKLWDSRLQQEQDIMADVEGFKKEIHKAFDEIYPGFEYDLYFYTDEREMLVHLFQCIHKISPDFLAIWNISFDIPYLMERMKALGLDPAEVMCDPEFLNKVCVFHKDTFNHEIKNKSDHFEISSKTVYVCQMETYAAVRKGTDELRRFSLDFISRHECESGGKYIYADKATSLRTLGYVDLKTYILYNIKDVLLQCGIEEVTHDLDYLYRCSYKNITAYEQVFMQTVTLRNIQYRSYDIQDKVPGANTNAVLIAIDRKQHPEKYKKKGKKPGGIEGALVGNSRLINRFGQKLYGRKTNFIFRYSIDMDMKAFYPSTHRACNISRSTLIFKASVDCSQYNVRGGKIPYRGFTDVEMVEDNTPSFVGDIAGEIFDNLQSKDILSTGYKWLNLPSISELIDEVEKEVNTSSVA